jgi:DUF4097 and DUF4098 domain-containing protein YvlB
MTQEAIEQTFQVHAPAQLSLANISGSVKILPGESDAITVKAFKNNEEGNSKRTDIEMTQAEDGSVTVKTHYRSESWLSFLSWKSCDVDYEVIVPSDCKLNLSGVSNTVLIQGIAGEMHISTVSGNVNLLDLRGKFEIKSVSGNVTGERLKSELKINTVSGDINFSDSTFQSIDGKTVSGDIYAETSLISGPYYFDSVSGDVCLVVPGESRFRVHSKSLSGDLKSFLPVDRITTQEGGVVIKHHSISGDMIIKSSQTSVAKPNLESETSTVNGRIDVLERLARKEISVEEAIQFLNKMPVQS